MTHRPTLRAANGIVASGHHLATVAGIAALRDGGSAVDAAIAAAAVCAVVLPHRTAIGGDVFALVYDSRARAVTAYNGSGAAPAMSDPDAFAQGFEEQGVRLATVPGCVAAWADMLADHGRLGLDRVLALETAYRDLRIVGQPPVSQGHILLEEFAIADGLDLRSMGWGSVDQIHTMVEIKKLAFADRDALAGDPRVVPFVVEELLDAAFIAQRRRAIAGRAAERVEPAALPADTTYLAAVDRDGNAVSPIRSVFSAFGSATMVPGTGILLNNRLSGFSLDPRSPNALAPGKRPVHTLNTVIV